MLSDPERSAWCAWFGSSQLRVVVAIAVQGSKASTSAERLEFYEARVASKPISTFINLETGQPAFAFMAIDWNVALSMPVFWRRG